MRVKPWKIQSFQKLSPKLSYDWFLWSWPLIWLGFGKRYPFLLLGENAVEIGKAFWWTISLAWLIGFLGIAFGFWNFEKSKLRSKTVKGLLLISVLLIPIFDILSFIQFRSLGYEFPFLLLCVDVVFLSVSGFLLKKMSALNHCRVCFAIFSAFSALHLACSIFSFPLVRERSDMMPLIGKAIDLFLSGKPAYEARFSDAYQLPYPPLLWMSYIPLRLLEMDLRWQGFVVRILLSTLLFRRFKNNRDALLFLSLWFANPFLAFRHDLYLDIFWLALVTSVELCLKSQWLFGAIVLGFSVALIQWSWILVPFYVFILIDSRNFRSLLCAVFGVLLISFGIFSIFYFREGKIFLDGLLQSFRLIGTQYHLTEPCLGLAWIFMEFKALGALSALIWLQRSILVVSGLAALFWWWITDDKASKNEKILNLSIITYIVFIFFNPLIENYFYLAPLLLIPYAFSRVGI